MNVYLNNKRWKINLNGKTFSVRYSNASAEENEYLLSIGNEVFLSAGGDTVISYKK